MTCISKTQNSVVRDDYFSVRQLKERGWTERLVSMYLPQSDHSVPNPHRKQGAPKRLYLVDKVLRIEGEIPEFQSQKERSAKYSVRLKVQSDAKRLHLEGLVRQIQLPLLHRSWADVRREAQERRFAEPALAERSVERVAVDFLLDTMKSLDWHLDEFVWHSGIRDARKLLRRRMLAHIINSYPMLADAAKDRAAKEDGNADGW